MTKSTIETYEEYLAQYQLTQMPTSRPDRPRTPNAGGIFAQAFIKELGEIVGKGESRRKPRARRDVPKESK